MMTFLQPLYREYSKHINIGLEGFNLTYAQKEMLKIAKNHMESPRWVPLKILRMLRKRTNTLR